MKKSCLWMQCTIRCNSLFIRMDWNGIQKLLLLLLCVVFIHSFLLSFFPFAVKNVYRKYKNTASHITGRMRLLYFLSEPTVAKFIHCHSYLSSFWEKKSEIEKNDEGIPIYCTRKQFNSLKSDIFHRICLRSTFFFFHRKNLDQWHLLNCTFNIQFPVKLLTEVCDQAWWERSVL